VTVAENKLKEIDRKTISRPGLKTFFRICERWGLTNDQQMILLGITNPSTFYKWRSSPPETLGKDVLERISYILGIYKSLQILLPENQAADTWVKAPNKNPLFGGKSALDRMLSGNVADLFVVRNYLDAQRGGWA
jgi:Protein of unknown function (DUF2384)